jgi:hypothetical protein
MAQGFYDDHFFFSTFVFISAGIEHEAGFTRELKPAR